MGVHGLWKLLDPSGKPVPLETLENKILAVDVSIWLHQVVKGFQDSRGNPLPNAHLLGLFHRVCKLLFYKIRPVFVFDGGVPHLKKQTVISRRQQKSKAQLESDRIREQLLKNLVKHAAVKRVLGKPAAAVDLPASQLQKEADMFELPPEQKQSDDSMSGSSDEDSHPHRNWSTADLHAIDVNSSHFKSLPADVRHDILSELKETRKQSSWGRLHEMPKESSDFSSYQMSRLLKRRSVQVSLEDAEREMGGHSLSLGELENLLNEQGVVNVDEGKRIASDSTTRYLYIKEIGSQILEVKADKNSAVEIPSGQEEEKKPVDDDSTPVEDEFLREVLSLIPEEESCSSADDDLMEYKEGLSLKAAQNFMFDNSDLTQQQILAVIQYQSEKLSANQPSTSGISKLSSAASSSHETCHTEKKEIVDNEQSPSKAEGKDLLSPCSTEHEKKCDELLSSSEAEGTDLQSPYSREHDKKIDQSLSPSYAEGKDLQSLCSTDHEKKIDSLLSSNKAEGTDLRSPYSREHDKKIDQSLSPSKAEGKDLLSSSKAEGKDLLSSCEAEGKDLLFSSEAEGKDLLSSSKAKGKDLLSPSKAEGKDLLSPSKAEGEDLQTPVSLEKEGCERINGRGSEPSSDSDNEGFVEVEGSHKSLEVVIQKGKPGTLEDDIFSDVFAEILTESVVNTSTDICKPEIQNTASDEVSDKEAAPATKMSSEELQQLQASLEEEHRDLLLEQGRQDRVAANITDQMCMEAQELLQLFGVPYIVAPMEAEAQCAFLDMISLTDGTITDDSDIWLFGGRKVYKNFFNQKKHVLEFQASSIKHYFKLERPQLVTLALLVGSDYTPGIQGVGPVTALEILAAFPPTPSDVLAGLQKFRNWLQDGMKVGPGKTPLKNKLKNVQFTEGFPSKEVVSAYLDPKVDESGEAFSWAFPDLESLRDFTRQKFGWTRTKSDEILLPVMKKQEERKSQRSLDSYFKVMPKLHAADGQLSKRVQQAVRRLGGEGPSENDDVVASGSQPKRKRVAATSRGRGRSSVTEQQESKPGNSEFIPQRERDKINALKSKLRAIEVFRTSQIDRGIKKAKKTKRIVLKQAKLSESSSESE